MSIQFILFLDPQTKCFYSFSEEKGCFIKENHPLEFDQLIQQQLSDRQFLMNKKKWVQLDSFHRRPFPKYLLPQRVYKYPVYITKKHMAQSLLEDVKFNQNGIKVKESYTDKVNIRVHFGSIKKQLESTQKKIQSSLEVSARFLISANEIIRIICRLILQEHRIVITTKNGSNKIVFKVRNQNQYIYGNQPIINFQCVRECVKKQEYINLEMVETSIKDKQQFRKCIFYRKWKDMQEGIFQPFPWQNLIKPDDNQFLLSYRPHMYYIKPVFSQQNDQSTNQLAKNYHAIRSKMEKYQKESKDRVPRYIWKDKILQLISKRQKDVKDMIIDLEGTNIYTGQCPFVYTFQITAITKLFSLFRGMVPHEKLNYPRPLLKFSNKETYETKNFTELPSSITRNKMAQELKRQDFIHFVPYQISLTVEFCYNATPLEIKKTPLLMAGNNISMKHSIEWKLLSKIMCETAVVFKINVWSKEGEGIVCGVGVIKLFDQYGFLRQGDQQIQMLGRQTIDYHKIGCMGKKFENNQMICRLTIKLPTFRKPVRWSLCSTSMLKTFGYTPQKVQEPKRENRQLKEEDNKIMDITPLLSKDPLRMMQYTDAQKEMLRKSKKYYKHQPDKLVNYLYSINWTQPDQILELYQILPEWAPLTPLQGLLLLTPHFSDQKVRLFATKAVQKMQDHDLVLYANQITQALVSFQGHNNPLIDFILQKCCQNPYMVGQQFFWQFKNRETDPIVSYRFTLYLQSLIMASSIRKQFVNQIKVSNTLVKMNEDMIRVATAEDSNIIGKNKYFKQIIPQIEKQLNKISPDGFSFPIRPQNYYKIILPKESKVFDSKKCPFSLACIPNVKELDKKSYKVMFKYGDDIKQDHLVLQIFSIFDNLWLDAGFDSRLNIYRVLSTGDQIGFIEIVDNAVNNSKIHQQFSEKVVKAFDQECTMKFLKKYNPDKQKMLIAKQNFIKSCAGYCVATYVLGIGDRHSGNIMVEENGKFFHIDFGHILGNFKQKHGIKRERTPMLLTSEHVFVMGGQGSQNFKRFQQYCTVAFNLLRKKGNHIISLLMMMVGAQLPQLQKYSDIEYVVKQLSLELSESQAAQKMINVIRQTLQGQNSRKLDNAFHEGNRIQIE